MTFADVGGVHADNIDALTAVGVVGGFPDGTFRPGEPVTRAQLASMLARTLDLARPGWRDGVTTTSWAGLPAAW